MNTVYCQYKFECDQVWEDLEETPKPNERFCCKCQEKVYWADTDNELEDLAKKGLCAASVLYGKATVGSIALVDRSEIPEEHRIYDLNLVDQEVTNHKLMAYKKELAQDKSLKDIKIIFESTPYILLQDADFYACEALQKRLFEYNIITEFKD